MPARAVITRIGALQPADLDFQARQLRVECALSGMRLKGTKTGEARTVDLSLSLVMQLQNHLKWIKQEALRIGQGEPQWLFPNREGKSLEERKIGRAFHRALKQAKIPAFRVYDFRHAAITKLAESGAGDETIMAIAGHVSRGMLSRYAHIRTEAKRLALEAIATKRAGITAKISVEAAVS